GERSRRGGACGARRERKRRRSRRAGPVCRSLGGTMDAADFRTVHAIPGRIRVKVGALKDNAALARELRERLAAEPGVRRAEANPTTGSLLVLYDTEAPGWRDHTRALSDQLRSVVPGVDPGEIAAR